MMRHDQLVFRTMVALARQREGFDEERTRAVLDLVCAAEEVRILVRQALHPLGLTELQFAVLIALLGLDPAPGTPAALADQTGVTRSAMTDALDRLQERGHIARTRSREDRRTLFIALTPAGHAAVEQAVPVVLRTVGELALPLEGAAPRALSGLCERLYSGTARLAISRN